MGEAMLRGLVQQGLPASVRIVAADSDSSKLERLSALRGFNAANDARDAARQGDVIVLAIKPQGFAELLPQLAPVIKPDALILSVAAGITLDKLQAAFPKTALIRVMPNTPALIGKGASAYCLGAFANDQHADVAENLLKPLGLVLRVQESAMDAVTALSGSGPAYIFLFMEAMQEAGKELGLDAGTAFALAAQTIAGAAAMIQLSTETPAQLRQKVTSPNGTTAAALKVFEEGDLKGLVLKAMRAANDRSVELGHS